MGTVVPETCRVIGLSINHNVASSWSNKSFHIKDARSHAHQFYTGGMAWTVLVCV